MAHRTLGNTANRGTLPNAGCVRVGPSHRAMRYVNGGSRGEGERTTPHVLSRVAGEDDYSDESAEIFAG